MGGADWPAPCARTPDGRRAARMIALSRKGMLRELPCARARAAQDPGVGDDGDAAALGLRELPGDDAAHDALRDLLVRQGRRVVDDDRARRAAVRPDLPLDGDLALELGVERELLLVAVAHL